MQFIAYVMLGLSAAALTIAAPLKAEIDQNIPNRDRPTTNTNGGVFSSAQNLGNGNVRGDGALARNSTIESGGALIAGQPVASQIGTIGNT
ncbi:hypothetical protein ONZ45_g16924 [Pleurotus djamor]|nr:hypothetical protein ONZ45_g16924 [Pleurotus djamor]